MLFRLKCLHLNGKTLTPAELAEAPRYVGNIIVEDWPQGGVFARHIRHARLLDMNIPQAPRDVIPSLFYPQLVRMLDDRMILHGYQIHADVETGARKYCPQAWVLCPVTGE